MYSARDDAPVPQIWPVQKPGCLVQQFGGARMLSALGDGIIATDRCAAITYMNPAAEQLTGWSNADAVGRPFQEVFPVVGPDGDAPFESPIAHVLREGRTVVLEGRPLLVRRDGSRIAIGDSAAPIHLDDGSIDGVVLVFRDASSARRDAERQELLARCAAELGSSLELDVTLRRVTEVLVGELATECAVELVDETGTARRVAYALAAGAYPLLIDEGSGPKVFRAALGSRRQTVGTMTVVLRSSDGKNDDLDHATLLTLAERISAAIESAQLYQKAEQLRVEAESASRAKDEFLAMLGHELRNPLAPIVSALDLMRRRGATPFERELNVIDRQLRHVVRLVDDLLDVSRIAHGHVTLERSRVDLTTAVQAAVERAQPLVDERGHDLIVDSPPGLYVCGDLDRLTQAIANLLVNAAKYTPPGGCISVATERAGERVLVRVRDDGVGIASEMLPRVFELFVQDQRSIDRAKGGLGIGLAVVRAIVEAHDGHVTASSEGCGKGTELVIDLPARSGPVAAPEATCVARASSPTRVLVVDDNVDAAELMSASLALLGYETYEAYDASSALVLARRLRPSAILLDIGLPTVDGYELAQRLRRTRGLERVQLIAVTGYGQPGDRERSRAAGFDAHLVKPVPLESLAELLEEQHSAGRCGAKAT